MKKIMSSVVLCAMFLSLVFASAGLMSVPASAATKESLSVARMINVVYDDSNSMLEQGRLWWCYAKYSLEIFSAMMQEKDQMNVYFMSQFRSDSNAAPIISGLSGRMSDQQSNIQKIHNTVTRTSGTPYGAIVAAYNNLKSTPSSFTEKWLVVITDGDKFDKNEGKSDLDGLFRDASAYGIKVVYLAIGSDLTPTPNEARGVFVKKADGNDSKGKNGILSRVTEISQIIFQRPQLIKAADGKITFDVPVSEIIVLAQGKNVSIGNISGMTRYSASAIMTSYDKDKATTNDSYKNQVRTEELNGTIATFVPSNGLYIKEGTYDFSIQAQEYTVYYKPCLDVELKICDKNGSVMTDYYIPKGSYTVEYGLTYPEGHEKHGVKITNTMFDVSYTLTCSVNGSERTLNGTSVDLKEGDTEITVEAKYLIFISQSATNKFVVEDFTVDELDVELEYLQKDYKLSTLESENDGLIVRVRKNGAPIPQEDWENFVLDCSADGLGIKTVKNGDGSFSVYPQYNNGSKKDTATGEDLPINISVSASNDHRKTDEGTVTAKINIDDDVSAADITVKIDPQEGEYDNKGFSQQGPKRTFSLKWRGQDLTKEQYEGLSLNARTEKENVNAKVVLDPYTAGQPVTGTVYFETVKTEDGGEPEPKDLKNTGFTVSAKMEREGEISSGEATDVLKIKDVRSFWEKFLDWLSRWWPLVAILLFILFYIVLKKWLPLKIKGVIHADDDIPITFRPYSGFNRCSPILTILTALIPIHPVVTKLTARGGRVTLRLRVKGYRSYACKVTSIPRGLPRGYVIDGMTDKKEISYNGASIETEDGRVIFEFGAF